MIRVRNKSIRFVVIITVLLGVFAFGHLYYQSKKSEPLSSSVVQQPQKDAEVVTENLNTPWEAVFLPDGEILVTERPGTLLLVKNRQKIPVEGVEHIGEGGLLGIAIHPDFKNNKFVYLYYTYSSNGDNTLNKVAKYEFINNKLKNERVIVDAIPGALNHNGGRIKFGPDNFLYITTGDAQNPSLAQDKNSLAGKILRVTDEGKPAAGNPFNNLVYSYGHRNPQGLVWDEQGRLWATEHGSQAHDELNLIEKGKNYGWPIIRGDEEKEGMRAPVLQSGSSTWAPAGAAYFGGSVFFGGLRGEALFEYKIAENSLEKHFENQFGRIRAVVLSTDGYLYLTTSNTDGRGTTKEGDDKLIKVNPKIFR